MKDRRCFVQFIHPGGEHGADDGDLKRWNTGAHKRKYLLVSGAYADDGETVESELAFWGEWEPQSRVIRRFADRANGLPAYVHKPLPPTPTPIREDRRQNTDPFVFGDRFLYTGCMQHTSRGPTQLRHLLPGSVVLFGSCHAKSRFVLDTAFVVAGSVDHGVGDVHAVVDGSVPDDYWPVTLEPWYADVGNHARRVRLYFGATPDAPIGDMFSFFPCLPANASDAPRFARPEIRIPGFITPQLTQGKKLARDLSARELAELWDETARQVMEAGLRLGVRADLPQRNGKET